jgi:hypothetical protein
MRIDETAAAKLLLVRAIETEDRDAALLTAEDRRYASQAALSGPQGRPGTSSHAGQFLTRRAEIALERLAGRFPSLTAYVGAIRWPLWLSVGIPIAALLLGLTTDAFAGNRLNIVAFPLLGLIAWNLAVFIVITVRWFVARVRPHRGSRGRLRTAVRRITQPASERFASQPTLERGLIRFAGDWGTASGPLTDARLRRTLHLGAALFAVGVVAAMLIRARYMAAYEAGWAGTWAGAEQEIATLLRIVLGPASLVTGLPLSSAAQLQELRGSSQNAGNWLLLWAVTAVLFVVLPRLVLALLNGLKAELLRRRLPIRQDFYSRSLLRDALGEPGKARLVAYGVDLVGDRRERLDRMLRAALGEKVSLTVDAPVAYGSEDHWLFANAKHLSESDFLILLFSLSSTPEAENHGAFAGAVREELADAPTSLIVLLEEGALRSRLQGTPSAERRLSDRHQAWRDVLAGARVEPILVSLEPSAENEAAEALERSLLRAGGDPLK